jgi:hypothetical protein
MDTEMASAPPFTAPPEPNATTDAEAPYGRRADGTPKAKPGRPKGSRSSTGSPAAPRPPRPRSSTPRKAASKPDYRQGVAGLFQLAAAPLALAGQRNKALLADSATLIAFSEPMANGLQTVAEQDARVAAVLDRVLSVGPYAAVIAPLIGLCTQLAVNHGVIPVEVGQSMGAAHPDAVIEHVTGQRPPETPPAA